MEELLQEIIKRELGTDGLSYYLRKTTINADDYLIELSDEQYEVVTEAELKEISDSAEEFDGFTGIRIVGRIKELNAPLDENICICLEPKKSASDNSICKVCKKKLPPLPLEEISKDIPL